MENKYKILVVDDEIINHFLINVILENTGKYTIIKGYDGTDAIKLVNQEIFDIILMDIRMPIMDGIEATKQIKKTHPNIPIISISAFTSDIIDTNIFDDAVNKPIMSNMLICKINKYLN